MGGLYEARFSHAAGTPEEGVVGRQAGREPPRIVEEDAGGVVDPLEQAERNPVDLRHGFEVAAFGMPDEGVSGLEIGRPKRGRAKPVQCIGNPFEKWAYRFSVAHL